MKPFDEFDQNATHGDMIEEASEESFPASDPPAYSPITGVGGPVHGEETPFEKEGDGRNWSARGEAVSRRIRTEHETMLNAMQRLESALAAPAPSREWDWSRKVLRGLQAMRESLACHVASEDAQGGIMDAIDTSRPTLIRRAQRLQRDHADLIQQTATLLNRVEHYENGERLDFSDIRRRAAWLLTALRHHQAQEADLIFETFCTDVGAGD